MKVLLIAPSNDSYGVAESLMTLVLALKETHLAEPVVLTKKKNKINRRCDEAGIENFSFWYADMMAGAAYSGKLLRALKHCVKFALYLWGKLTRPFVFFCGIRFDEIDVVHTCHNRNDIGAYIAKKRGLPHVWHIREFGEEDYNVRFYKKNYIAYMNQNADAFIAISDAVAKKWIGRGIEAGKMNIVYNGIDPELFYPDGHKPGKVLKIAITSRVQPTKGQLQLVRAVALLTKEEQQQLQVDIIGDAYQDYKGLIEKVIQSEKLGNTVRFLGHCDHLNEMIRTYDIGVVCSKAEAFGRVTAEYMMSGLAVIASDTGANQELIEDGRDGLLYKYDYPEALAGRIRYLCGNIDCISQMGQKGREHALREFTKRGYTDKVAAIYRMLLEKHV